MKRVVEDIVMVKLPRSRPDSALVLEILGEWPV